MRILFPLRRPFGSTSRRDYQSTTRAIDGGGLNDQGCQTFQMNVTGQSFPVEPLSPVKYHIILPKRSKIFRYVSSPWLFKPRLVLTTFPPLHFPRPSLLSRVDYTSCRPKHFISLMISRPFHLPTNVLSMIKIAWLKEKLTFSVLCLSLHLQPWYRWDSNQHCTPVDTENTAAMSVISVAFDLLYYGLRSRNNQKNLQICYVMVKFGDAINCILFVFLKNLLRKIFGPLIESTHSFFGIFVS